ncbi:MAG: Ig-like domain-containing protein [Halobacteriota archaeon]
MRKSFAISATALIFLFLLALTPVALSLDNPFFVYGDVYYSTGATVPAGVPVTVRDVIANGEVVTQTDAAGHYQIDVSPILNSEDGDPFTCSASDASESGSRSFTLNLALPSQRCDINLLAGPTPIPTAPTVQVLYPNGGELIARGTSVQVSAHAADDVQVVAVAFFYSSDGGSTWVDIIGSGTRVSGTATDGAWNATWDTTGLTLSSNYLIKATATDNAGLTAPDQSDATFTIAPPLGPTVNDTEITSGTETVTGNVTINETEITITTTPDNAARIADQINDTGKISYDLPPEFEGATIDIDLEVTDVNETTGEVTATATKKTLNNEPKIEGDFTVDCDIEFPGDFTPENMTFSLTLPNTLSETVTEDIRDQVLNNIKQKIKELFGIDVEIDPSAVAPLAIKVTMDEKSEGNATSVSAKMTVKKSSDWWLKTVREDTSKVCMVKIDDNGNIIYTQYSDAITVLDETPSGSITFTTTFPGFSVFALMGYKPAPVVVGPPPVGGGGAGPAPEMNVPVDPETGAVLETTTLTVDDATLTIPEGTIVRDAEGNALSTSISLLHAPTIAESIGAIKAYDCGPGGTTFNPPIDLVIGYDPADIPAGFTESDLVIRMWDGTAWIDLDTSIDTVAHTATAKVSHFTIFGLFAAPPVAPPPVTPTPTVMPTATPTVTPTPTPSPIPRIRMAIVIVVVVAIVAAAIIVAVAFVPRMRRRKKS